MRPASRLRSVPAGFLLCLAVACVLYVAVLLAGAAARATGDAVVGQAIAMLELTAGLWLMLAILLLIGGLAGHMPRWVALAVVPLLLLSGVAAAVGLDMVSRRLPWAIVFPALLPPLLALVASAARFADQRRVAAAPRTMGGLLAAILILSLACLLLAAEY